MIRAASNCLIGALVLLIPALLNGFPLFFYDTAQYLELGQAAASKVWSGEPVGAMPGPSVETTPPALEAQANDEAGALSYAGGRSIFYSIFLHLAEGIGTLWLSGFLQALIGSFLIWRVVRELGTQHETRIFLGLVAGLTAASTLPYFATMAMPDVFAGYAVIGAALLAVSRPGAWQKLPVFLITIFAILAHATIAPLVAVAIALGWAAFMLLGRSARYAAVRLVPAAGTLALALLATFAYGQAVKLVMGEEPRSPPYLMARVLADGPGRMLLQDACAPRPAFAICAFQSLPLSDANEILWSADPAVGVFTVSGGATRRALKDEEMAFVTRAVASYPGTAFAAALGNWGDQLAMLQLESDFAAIPEMWRTTVGPVMGDNPSITQSLAFAQRWPWGLIDLVNRLALVVSLAFLAFRLTRHDVRQSVSQLRSGSVEAQHRVGAALLAAFAIAVVLIIANAALTGALSGPSARYQTRLVWLVPGLAILTAARLGLTARRPATQALQPSVPHLSGAAP
ncbi:hypothetical protein J3454_13300 [Erythrobacter sp. NFXS35]|uniref:hypothetical protein n=1 Tax=Erythrobacter sp. NFXS35 TaxID=2818436 RepID=UPI0032DF6664